MFNSKSHPSQIARPSSAPINAKKNNGYGSVSHQSQSAASLIPTNISQPSLSPSPSFSGLISTPRNSFSRLPRFTNFPNTPSDSESGMDQQSDNTTVQGYSSADDFANSHTDVSDMEASITSSTENMCGK